MHLKHALALALALASLSVPTASAAASGYAGLDLGSTRVDSPNYRGRGTGVFGGWIVNERVAVEAGWRRLAGDPRSSMTHASALARADLGSNWSVYGRLGVAKVGGLLARGEEGGSARLLVGGGLHLGLTQRVAMRVELQQAGAGTRTVNAGLMVGF